MKQFKDVDFLHATARVRTLENKMLSRRDLQKMIECRSFEEAFKVLCDAGIAVGKEPAFFEEGLSENLIETYNLVAQLASDPRLIALFRYKYDGHNLKTIIKARLAGGEYKHILTELGNVPSKELEEEFESGRFEKLNPLLARAAAEADEALAKTSDPQAVAILIDRAVLEAMADHVADYDCRYLADLVAAQIDIANIRATVRIKRMGKDLFFLRRVLADGGRLDTSKLQQAFTKGPEDMVAVIAASDYGSFLEPTFEGLRVGASLGQFERYCDNCMVALVSKAKMVPFGVEPLIAYLFAKENEIKAARIVLTSKAAGVSSQQITEHLRDTLS